MSNFTDEWLPLDVAAEKLGYSLEGLRRRLRQLRQQGYVEDRGRPPAGYGVTPVHNKQRVVVLWANPKTALIRSDAPRNLLLAKRGKRKRAGE